MKEGLLWALIFILIVVATTMGIFYHTHAPRTEGTSARGQHVVYQGDGIYRFDPASFAREGIVWDVVNLFIGVPLFALAAIGSLRNRLRGRLLLGGLLAYFWYVYLSCVMMYAFNNLFLVYVGILALCLVAFVLNIQHIKISDLPLHIGPRFPRRLFIGFSIAFAVILIALWLGRLVPIIIMDRFPEEFAGYQTFGSQALDLSLLVPMGFATAFLLAKKSPWGVYLLSISMTSGFMMFIAIPAWITVPLIQDGQTNILEAIPFFALSVLGLALTAVFYVNMKEKESR